MDVQHVAGPAASGNRPPFPKILHINRQIRNEVLPISYKQTPFTLTFLNNEEVVPHEPVPKWLDLIGPTSASLIKHFEVFFEDMDYLDVAMCIDQANKWHKRGRKGRMPMTIYNVRKRDIVKALLLDRSSVPYDVIKAARWDSDLDGSVYKFQYKDQETGEGERSGGAE